MARNTGSMKRGFNYDKVNSKLCVMVDGVEAMHLTTTTATISPAGTAELTVSASATYPATSDGNALGTTSYMWSDLFLASGGVINFNAGDITITHSSNLLTIAGGGLTMGSVSAAAGDFIAWGTNGAATNYKLWFDVNGDTNGAFYFGGDDYGMDVGFYGQTASKSMLWDASANGLTFTGSAFTMGASAAPAGDFILYGTQATLKVWFDVNGDTNGAWYFGGDDYGFDVGFYGQTASNAMLWDASANALKFTAGSLQMGTGSGFLLPVKASGESIKGYVWLDTTDNYIHYYGNGAEMKVTNTTA